MIIEVIIFIVSSLLAYFLYSYKKVHYYLSSKGVKYLPGWPVFGNALMSALQKKHVFEDMDTVYKAFPDERYVGYLDNKRLVIMVRDPELVRLTTVKDFDHFVDHSQFIPDGLNPLIDGSLLFMRGDRWREMRATLSPAFTGSKMRHLMHFMTTISQNLIDHLKGHLEEDFYVDDLIRRYTTDVIAATSFGLQVNSLKDRDNQFFRAGQQVFNFNFSQIFKIVFAEQFPDLTKKLGIKLHPKEYYKFFEETVEKTMNHRKANNVRRLDMIQLLMDTSKEWSTEELTSQAFIFFAAGFETVASSLVMCLHELTINPEIQERLYQEIRDFKEMNEELNSDNLPAMKYLDCVINETLRKWSPAITIDRTCVKTYELPPPRDGGKPYVLKPGDQIYNSCNSLHLDPQYFPDPLTFNPDRFSDENKHNIKPFTYMPFGSGPRICIGVRFAIMEMKTLMYYILLNYKLEKCAKTSDPIELISYGFNMQAKSGTWAQFKNRC